MRLAKPHSADNALLVNWTLVLRGLLEAGDDTIQGKRKEIFNITRIIKAHFYCFAEENRTVETSIGSVP